MYAIKIDYRIGYVESFDYDITMEMYLGTIYPPVNIFIFEEDVTENTKLFGSFEDAARYIEAHTSLCDPNGTTCGNPRVVKI